MARDTQSPRRRGSALIYTVVRANCTRSAIELELVRSRAPGIQSHHVSRIGIYSCSNKKAHSFIVWSPANTWRRGEGSIFGNPLLRVVDLSRPLLVGIREARTYCRSETDFRVLVFLDGKKQHRSKVWCPFYLVNISRNLVLLSLSRPSLPVNYSIPFLLNKNMTIPSHPTEAFHPASLSARRIRL